MSVTLASLFGSDHVVAQTCYRVTRLAPLNFTPSLSGSADASFGINEQGEVAFTAAVDIGGGVFKKHAFVWLPQPNYGFEMAGLKDLHMLSGLDSQEESAAHDINDAGQVVGEIGEVGAATSSQAAAWRLVEGTVPLCALGTFFGGDWAVAFAINNADPPLIVGDAQSGAPPCEEAPNGFAAEVDLDLCQVLAVDRLFPNAGDDGASTRDVDTPVGGPDPRVAAFSFEGFPPLCANGGACETSKDALEWRPPLLTGTVLQKPGLLGGGEARANNETGQLAGWAFLNSNFPCRSRALFWANVMATPFDLHSDATPPLPSTDDSRADGINSLGSPQVVGGNVFQASALL